MKLVNSTREQNARYSRGIQRGVEMTNDNSLIIPGCIFASTILISSLSESQSSKSVDEDTKPIEE